MFSSSLILFYEVAHQTEYWLVAVEADSLICVEDGVIVLEGVTILIFQEDAGHMSLGKGIMVAVGCQVAAMQGLEVFFLGVDLLEESEAAHTLFAHLTILGGVVITNHVDIKEVSDLAQRHLRMLGIPSGTTQVGILA